MPPARQVVTLTKAGVKQCSATQPIVTPAESRGPSFRGTSLSLSGKPLRLLEKFEVVEAWVPAFEGVIQSREKLKFGGHR
jgi:hypothetical protein